MHIKNIRLQNAEPLLARLEGAQDTVIGIIIDRAERQRRNVGVLFRANRFIGNHDATDLGGERVFASVMLRHHGSKTTLRTRVTVKRCGIEIANAAFPCLVERAFGFLVGRDAVEITHLGATKAHDRDFNGTARQFTCIGDFHRKGFLNFSVERMVKTVCGID